jgi:hypothetical protein
MAFAQWPEDIMTACTAHSPDLPCICIIGMLGHGTVVDTLDTGIPMGAHTAANAVC